MRTVRFWIFLSVVGLSTHGMYCSAAAKNLPNVEDSTTAQQAFSIYAKQADWTFSGRVVNENDEHYNYFFQIQRDNNQLHGIATLIDEQSKAILIYEESNSLIEKPELMHWQTGNLFLRFNSINNSWVFGVKNKSKKGFNFKIDMLGLTNTQSSKPQNLRDGIELLVSQTGRLNGHLQTDKTGKEQFVTAKKSWFRQIWVSKPQLATHSLVAILCELTNGSAFYSVSLPGSDSVRGSVAGWRDTQGVALPMSQFVSYKQQPDNNWRITIFSPKIELSFSNLLAKLEDNNQLIFGVITGTNAGFCTISHDEISD